MTKPSLVAEPPALILNAPLYTKPSIISESPLVVKPASMTTSTTIRRLQKEKEEDRLEEVLNRLERRYGFDLPTDGIPAIFRNQIRIRNLRDGWAVFLQFLEQDFEHFLMDYSYINLTIDQKRTYTKRGFPKCLTKKRHLLVNSPEIYLFPHNKTIRQIIYYIKTKTDGTSFKQHTYSICT